MGFIVRGIVAEKFRHLYGRTDAELAALGVHASVVSEKPGAPCRVSLRELEAGERVLLLNYCHLEADSPYRSSHAIFVADGAERGVTEPGQLPEVIACRSLISVRAWDDAGMMLDARLVNGPEAAPVFRDMLALDGVSCLHTHTAGRGCFLARVDRIQP